MRRDVDLFGEELTPFIMTDPFLSVGDS
jgi:hypothetical protein